MTITFDPSEIRFKADNRLVLDIVWRGNVGIVLAYDTGSNNWHGYIGFASPATTEERDARRIMDWGYRMSKEECIPFFPRNQKAWDSDAQEWRL